MVLANSLSGENSAPGSYSGLLAMSLHVESDLSCSLLYGS